MRGSSGIAVRLGRSIRADEGAAIAELAEQIQQDDVKAVLLFCSPGYDLDRLASAMDSVLDCRVIGCTSAGELGAGGFVKGGVSAISLAGAIEVDSFRIDLETCESDSAGVAERIGGILGEAGGQRAFGLLLVDGLSLAEERLAASLYQSLGQLPIVGGSAADDLTFTSTRVYVDGAFRAGVASFTVFRTEVPFTTFKFDHFLPTDRVAVITASDPSRRIICEINGIPAAQAYAELVGVEVGQLCDRVFSSNPLVLELHGEQYIRSVAWVDEAHNMKMFCAIEDGVVLSIGRTVDPAQAAIEAFERVKERIGPPALVIGCDCVLRRLEFDSSGLLASMGRIMAANRVFGFSTYGEQYNAVHVNQTFTGIALGA